MHLTNSEHHLSSPIILMGAALDTANLGCTALSLSVISEISRHLPSASLAVGDFGRGFRTTTVLRGHFKRNINLFGSVNTYRLHRPDSIYGMAICSYFGGLGHPVIRLFRSATAIMDISGGDSFSDIYGLRFFHSNTLRKKLALREGKSLILLPQTYGPYQSVYAQKTARKIMRGCAMAWARDRYSYDVLQEMLGDDFDAGRHRLGVDVAFKLPVVPPPDEVTGQVQQWIESSSAPIVGFNVSGLLLNQPEAAAVQYGLKADYGESIVALLDKILRESEARVLFVPHVLAPPGHRESDVEACEIILARLRSEFEDRVAVCPLIHDPCEIKWVISQCDWFCGTRMHSTIAALSTGVPTAAISYSPKTLGVFETCGQGAHVADPRAATTEEVVDCLWRSFLDRENSRDSLEKCLPGVLKQADMQFEDILRAIDAPMRDAVEQVG